MDPFTARRHVVQAASELRSALSYFAPDVTVYALVTPIVGTLELLAYKLAGDVPAPAPSTPVLDVPAPREDVSTGVPAPGGLLSRTDAVRLARDFLIAQGHREVIVGFVLGPYGTGFLSAVYLDRFGFRHQRYVSAYEGCRSRFEGLHVSLDRL